MVLALGPFVKENLNASLSIAAHAQLVTVV